MKRIYIYITCYIHGEIGNQYIQLCRYVNSDWKRFIQPLANTKLFCRQQHSNAAVNGQIKCRVKFVMQVSDDSSSFEDFNTGLRSTSYNASSAAIGLINEPLFVNHSQMTIDRLRSTSRTPSTPMTSNGSEDIVPPLTTNTSIGR